MIQHKEIVSCSHWGMFEAHRHVFSAPPGFKFSDQDRKDWTKPGGIILIERIRS